MTDQHSTVITEPLLPFATTHFEWFVLSTQENAWHFNMTPFGAKGKKAAFIDVLNPKHAGFIELVNRLDGLSYGNKNLAIPKWVQLDCASLPSGIVGLAMTAKDLPQDIKERFEIESDYPGLVPVSEYCAIPSAGGSWIGHTCASLMEGSGLGLFTKVLALAVYQAQRLRGISQYENTAVKLHTRISNLALASAVTPAHGEPWNTFVYQHEVHQDKLESILCSPSEKQDPTLLLDPSSMRQKLDLQKRIEDGESVSILYPGHVYDEHHKLLIPIKIVSK